MSATAALTLLDAANEYRERSFPVVPVIGKEAIVKWKSYQERLPTKDEMERWRWDDATGLAIVIGPGLWANHRYLWVLEIEARHREHAEPWLDAEIPHWRSAG